MKNNFKLILAVLFLILIGGLLYFSKDSAPNDEPAPQTSVVGCYVATLAKDVYTLNIQTQSGDNITGKLAFKNFEKDSSSGPIVGTFKDDILLAEYSFTSEGTDSVMQVIFKKSGNTFIRGYGEMNATGDRFADVNNITFDPNQTFISSPCI